MTDYAPVCRVCLAMDVNLHQIADTPLQFVYERLTSNDLYTTDKRPLLACYLCYALLRKSYKLMMTSVTAENLLNVIVKQYSKITKSSVSKVDRKLSKLDGSMVISPPECIDSTPRKPPPANAAQNPLPAVGPSGDANLPDPAVDIKIEKEEEDDKTEYVFEDMEDSPPSPDVEESVSEDVNPTAMETETGSERVSESPQEPVVKIELSWEEPGTSTEQLKQTTDTSAEGAVVKRTLRLAIPRQTGEKFYQCTICHYETEYRHVYKNHLRTHTGEKPYTCPLCERKFSLSTNLKTHIKTHSSEKPFSCNLCQKQYKRRDLVKRHMATHTGDRPFECMFCNRRFTRKYHLIRHTSIHTGEKPFECNVCQWRFNNKNNLQIHLRTHTGEKLYSCDVCKREFKLKATLRIHLLANNGNEVFNCIKCKRKCHYTRRKGPTKLCKKCCLKRKKELIFLRETYG